MIDTATAGRLLARHHGVTGELTPLPGEHDDNFRVEAAGGERSILKVMHEGCPVERVERQCAVLAHLERHAEGFRHPSVLETTDGRPYATIDVEGTQRIVWRLTWCDGTLLADFRPRTRRLADSFGRLLGRMVRALASLDLPDFEPGHPWRLTRALDVRPRLEALDGEARTLVAEVLGRFEQRAAERLRSLPRQVVYNDANDRNVLVSQIVPADPGSAVVDAAFDFGDLCVQPRVCDLAIGIAYAILGDADPLATAAAVVRGFVDIEPLSGTEADLLFDLVSTRLAMSVAIAAERGRRRPDEAYLAVSRQSAERALARLAEIEPPVATARLRHAAGLEPVPGAATAIGRLADDAAEIVPAVAIRGDVCVLDLGSGSSWLGADPAATALEPLTERIEREMARVGARYAIGRWAESRAIYTAPAFTGGRHATEDGRTHHLGLDVFCPAGTPIRAPIAGVVEIATYNAEPLDYGGLVVLRHETPGGAGFYTLYGHLSADGVARLSPGDELSRGALIAHLGTPAENGGWTPHLHIQIVVDLLDLGADFPGVARESEASFWRTLSPNPERLLGFSGRSDFDGRTDVESIRRRRAARLGPSLSLSYARPLHIVRGFRQFLYDSRARAYLDLYNNVPHAGHSHPRVVEAVARQIALLNTNTRYLHETVLNYADRLTATMPEDLSVCFFVNSGSEANELALRLARVYTGREGLLVAQGAYHGHTLGLIDASPYKHDGPGGSGAPDWVHTVANPDGYRGPWKRDDPEAGRRYADLVREALDRAAADGRPVGAFLSETYPSVAGQIVPPAGYVAAAYEHARAAGAVVVADEIQTGFGRLGDAFWGFEAQGAVPDIVALGKPIANGFPMGAVVTTREIAETFDNGMEFFATFGGNPAACAAALAVLDVVEDEGLQERARSLGGELLRDLGGLALETPVVGDVRGQGFFLGLELVRDRETLEPADREARYVVERLRDRRILTGTDGVHHNVVKVRPSMVVEREDLELFVRTLREVLGETPISA